MNIDKSEHTILLRFIRGIADKRRPNTRRPYWGSLVVLEKVCFAAWGENDGSNWFEAGKSPLRNEEK